MRPLRDFEEFLREGIVKIKVPDIARATSLIKESEKRKMFIDEMHTKLKVTNENADYFVENAYDVLIGMIWAKLLTDGFKSSGEGAHEAEISYLRRLHIAEADIRFMNSLRYFRNGIKYYGEAINKDYAESVLLFMDKFYLKLKKLLDTII